MYKGKIKVRLCWYVYCVGELGDPWLLSAVSSLTLTPRFLDRVVPPDQSFEHGYCGVFRFRFWHFGDWVEVSL